MGDARETGGKVAYNPGTGMDLITGLVKSLEGFMTTAPYSGGSGVDLDLEMGQGGLPTGSCTIGGPFGGLLRITGVA